MAQFIASVLTISVVIHLMLIATAYLILLERKSSAWIQDRVGPNRVGPWGLLQPIADGLKFLLKEDYTPLGVDRGLFFVAPALAVIPALIGWAVIPWGGFLAEGSVIVPAFVPVLPEIRVPETLAIAVAPINIGVVFILAVGSLSVYGLVVGAYASNNKYSFFGGIRATAQMVSYEIPMGLCVLIVVLMYGTLRADWLVELQANGVWNLFYQPILAVIFFTCLLAETNRAPFDLAEAEQELVAGYHTEYSSMRFALYFLGEYLHMVTASAFFALLFLGGWDLPFVQEPRAAALGWVYLKFVVFLLKILALLFLMMWIRWTLPRFRFDQLMRLAWQALIPITIVTLLVSGVLVFLKMPLYSHLIANVVIAAAVLAIRPLVPKGPPVNRRVALAGSRFSPPPAAS